MKSFPFDSEVTYTETGEPVYDRASNSQELRDYFHLMYTDGVFPNPSTGLQVVAYSEEMSVSVLPGNVIIRGAFGIEESTRTLVFQAAGTAYDRIDAVVARLNTNYNYRKIDLYVVKGVESASPVAPELTREGGIYELRLANVFIAKNTTIITTERITDTRLNTDDCGIVTANPTIVDTTAIFDQYQASLDKYLKYVKECIDGTTAANLQNQIDEVNSNLTDVNNSLSNVGVLDWDNAVDINISLTGNTSYTPTKRGIYFGCVQANDSTNVTFSITDVLTNKIMSYMNVPKGWLRESIIVPLNANREIIINVVNGNTCLFSYFVPFK